ncbi:hypothetical protein ACOMHN_047067 [Nucella lapillus]
MAQQNQAALSALLVRALLGGSWEDVDRAVRRGATIGSRLPDKHTPLHHACFGNNIAVAQRLLNEPWYRYFIRVNERCPNGRTALQTACMLGSMGMVDLLLDHDADPTIPTAFVENTALHFACVHGHAPVVRKLLQHVDVDHDALNSAGNTPLMMACFSKSAVIVKMLIDDGANVNIQDEDGKTALFMSISHRSWSIVRLLLDGKADPNLADTYWGCPLHLACHYNRADIVAELIEHGADVNATNILQLTPLWVVALKARSHLIRLLLESGANVSPIVNVHSSRARRLNFLSRHGLSRILEVLFDQGVNISKAIECLEEVRENGGSYDAIGMFTECFADRLTPRGLHSQMFRCLAARLCSLWEWFEPAAVKVGSLKAFYTVVFLGCLCGSTFSPFVAEPRLSLGPTCSSAESTCPGQSSEAESTGSTQWSEAVSVGPTRSTQAFSAGPNLSAGDPLAQGALPTDTTFKVSASQIGDDNSQVTPPSDPAHGGSAGSADSASDFAIPTVDTPGGSTLCAENPSRRGSAQSTDIAPWLAVSDTAPLEEYTMADDLAT